MNIWCNRDFDVFDLRMCLFVVVSILYKVVKCNGGVIYVYCIVGMGRVFVVVVCCC